MLQNSSKNYFACRRAPPVHLNQIAIQPARTTFFYLEDSDTLDVGTVPIPTVQSGLRFMGNNTPGRGEGRSSLIGLAPPSSHQTRVTQMRSSVYDTIYEEQESRGARAQIPPIDVGPSHEPDGEAPAPPQNQPLPSLRPGTHRITSPGNTPYSTDRLPHEPAPPPLPPSYPPDPYAPYTSARYSRRLSQQEPEEQVSHLGVPERRAYRPPPKESKDKLKLWLSTHVEHPYPTEEEKKELLAETGMTMRQVSPLTPYYFPLTNISNLVV